MSRRITKRQKRSGNTKDWVNTTKCPPQDQCYTTTDSWSQVKKQKHSARHMDRLRTRSMSQKENNGKQQHMPPFGGKSISDCFQNSKTMIKPESPNLSTEYSPATGNYTSRIKNTRPNALHAMKLRQTNISQHAPTQEELN
jgi:hypothetical protein